MSITKTLISFSKPTHQQPRQMRGAPGCGRTKHISVKYTYLQDAITNQEVWLAKSGHETKCCRRFDKDSGETLHRFRDVNPVLSDIHTPTSSRNCGTKSTSADVSFSELSICAVCSSFLLTRGESTPFAPVQLHALQSTFDKFRVSFQRHLVIQHIDFDCSIQDIQTPSRHLQRIQCARFASPRNHFSRRLSQRFATASVVPPRRSRHHDTIL